MKVFRKILLDQQAGPFSTVDSRSDSRTRGPRFNTRSGHILSFLLPLIQEEQLSVTGERYVREVLVNCIGGLSLPRKCVARLTDSPDMTIDVYCGCKIITQLDQQNGAIIIEKNQNQMSLNMAHMCQ